VIDVARVGQVHVVERAAARHRQRTRDAIIVDDLARDERDVEPLRLRAQLDERALALDQHADADRFDHEIAIALGDAQHGFGGAPLLGRALVEPDLERHAGRAEMRTTLRERAIARGARPGHDGRSCASARRKLPPRIL
jgi:hypothetical protein